MEKTRSSIIAAVVVLILLVVALVFSIIGHIFGLGVITAFTIIAWILFMIGLVKKYPLNKQFIQAGICLYLLAVAELIIYFHDKSADKSNLALAGIMIIWGTVDMLRSRQLKSN
jgi:hypothetical protein